MMLRLPLSLHSLCLFAFHHRPLTSRSRYASCCSVPKGWPSQAALAFLGHDDNQGQTCPVVQCLLHRERWVFPLRADTVHFLLRNLPTPSWGEACTSRRKGRGGGCAWRTLVESLLLSREPVLFLPLYGRSGKWSIL